MASPVILTVFQIVLHFKFDIDFKTINITYIKTLLVALKVIFHFYLISYHAFNVCHNNGESFYKTSKSNGRALRKKKKKS